MVNPVGTKSNRRTKRTASLRRRSSMLPFCLASDVVWPADEIGDSSDMRTLQHTAAIQKKVDGGGNSIEHIPPRVKRGVSLGTPISTRGHRGRIWPLRRWKAREALGLANSLPCLM
jgi:hypothetical protein